MYSYLDVTVSLYGITLYLGYNDLQGKGIFNITDTVILLIY